MLRSKQHSGNAASASARFGRRAWLRAAAGLLALPALDTLAPARAEAAPTPPRLLIYTLPNGRVPEWWVPSESGGKLVFPGQASALNPYGDRILALSGLSNNAALKSPGAAHAMGSGTLLTSTAIPSLGGGLFNNVSVDQVIAQSLDPAPRFKSLQWSAGEPGPCDVGGAPCAYTQSVSWSAPKSPMVPLITPHTAFEQLFSAGVDGVTGPAEAARRRSLGSVLDFLHQDGLSLGTELGAADKDRLDEYFTAVREVELGLAASVPACEAGGSPPEALAYPERVEAFHDLIALALRCNQTRVLTFMIEFGLSGRSHPFINAPGGHHGLSHDQTAEGRAQLSNLETWQAQKVASLLGKLDAVKELDGRSLLENTVVLVVPDMGFGHLHDHGNITPLLVGGTGHMRTDGRKLAFSGEPLANLHVTLLRAFGIQQGTFGLGGAIFGDDGSKELANILV